MAKARKKASRRKGGAAPRGGVKAKPAVDLEPLRRPVEEAKGALAAAESEAAGMTEKARALVADAKEAYRRAVALFRAACRKAGVECPYEGGRGTNVSAKVSFEVERVEKGIRVTVRGRPDTAETIPFAVLKESVNRAAYDYATRNIGPREEVGNKGGSLSNRLRAVLR